MKNRQPRVMAVDGTGVDSTHRSRHYEKRLEQTSGVNKTPTPYTKLDILIDAEDKYVYDFVIRTQPRHDVVAAKDMFKRLKPQPEVILGDRGYDSEELHQILELKQVEFHAPVRDFRVKKPRGKGRQKSLTKHEEAGKRSIVESVIRSLKSKLGSLTSKKHWMKKRELAWHILTYNLEKQTRNIKQHLFQLLYRATKN